MVTQALVKLQQKLRIFLVNLKELVLVVELVVELKTLIQQSTQTLVRLLAIIQ